MGGGCVVWPVSLLRGRLAAEYTGKMMVGSVVEENEGLLGFGQKGGE